MARYDAASDGFPSFPSVEDDNWADAPGGVAPEPDQDEQYDYRIDGHFDARYDDGYGDGLGGDFEHGYDASLGDDSDERYLESIGTTPAYDLGPSTDTFIIDLTGSMPAVSGSKESSPPPPAATPEPPQPTSQAFDYLFADPAPEQETPPSYRPAYGTDGDATQLHDTRSAAWQSGSAEQAQPAQQPQPAAPAPTHAAAEPVWDVPPAPKGGGRGAESLTADNVLRSRRARPQSGWRRSVFEMTGGKVNLGLSPADVRRNELIARARTPIRGCHRLAVISLKGGVGKTTTTAALGAMLADVRGDRVIAVDANPDRGTLAERVPRENGATVRHLLDARDRLHRYADVRSFTSQSPTRLEVLASDADPRISAALSEQDYRDTMMTLERFYNLVLTDCGTGLLHDAMRGILGLATSLVVVSSASLDGARSASATLDWLQAHGFEHLARNAVVVISSVRPGGGIVDVLQLQEHFASRCREVVTIPYDPHLEAGGVLDLTDLGPLTLDAYRNLAAAVGEGFAASNPV
jgi:MinD-like ATPase involved in chromosome partitioning or flagellar assembly